VIHNTVFRIYICIGYYYVKVYLFKNQSSIKKQIIMKNSIVYLGVALVAFANVSFASDLNSFNETKNEVIDWTLVTPLGVAISKGDVESVRKFIEYGADVNEVSNGMSPLMIAARYNKTEIIKLLLSKGANLKQKDENGFTALKHAELSNAKEAVELLKQN
jgi:uncharacterized protein